LHQIHRAQRFTLPELASKIIWYTRGAWLFSQLAIVEIDWFFVALRILLKGEVVILMSGGK